MYSMDSFWDASIILSNFWGSVQCEATQPTQLNPVRVASSSLESNKEAGMPKRTLLLGLLMICMALLIFTWMVRDSLCELRFRQKQTELAAVLAYEVKR